MTPDEMLAPETERETWLVAALYVAIEQADKLTREREEARAEVERYKAIRDRGYPNKSWDTLILQLADAEKERDGLKASLREYLRQYEGVYDSIGPHGQQIQSFDARCAEEGAREALAKFGGEP